MGPFEQLLRQHDWYYQYSDDRSEWARGQQSEARILFECSRLGCPYAISELRRWAMGVVQENFREVGPNQWLRNNNLPWEKPVGQQELLSPGLTGQIVAWLAEHDL